MAIIEQTKDTLSRFRAAVADNVAKHVAPLWSGASLFRRRRAAHLRLGRRGETLACSVLRRLGLDILTCNFRTGRGEVDIVARDHTTLCFVEVKTRRVRPGVRPADAVTLRKQHRIIRAAHRYLRELGWPDVAYRYDIVEIVLQGDRVVDVRYWPGAFTEQPLAYADVMPRL